MMNNVEYTNSCCFNKGVDCGNHECDDCGWNPEVNAKRVKEIKARIKAEDRRN